MVDLQKLSHTFDISQPIKQKLIVDNNCIEVEIEINKEQGFAEIQRQENYYLV